MSKQNPDLVMLDIKHIDSEKHRWLTGHGNENILDCARYLSDIGKPVWIRHVLVPGITDDEESLRRLRAFLDTLYNINKVEVLPYHTLGLFKWQQLGIPYTLSDVPTPTAEQVAKASQILTK
jgi:pyruvate formate lyase activating enzyme